MEDMLPGLLGLFTFSRRLYAHIPQRDLESFGQKSHLSHALLEDVIFKYCRFLEHDRVRHKGDD